MSTDLLTRLAEYGEHHRETQEKVRPGEVANRSISHVVAPRRPNYALRRAGAALIAAALVILVISIPALLRGPLAEDPAELVGDPTPLETPSTRASTVEGNAPSEETYRVGPVEEGDSHELVMVHALADDSLVGLALGSVWRSGDSGETWEEWYAQSHEIDLLAVAPDGAVLAVRNPNTTNESAGEGSTVNDTPEVHRHDPVTDKWTVIPLPRPDLPSPDVDAQEENIEECGLFGLQSWVDGSAIAVGEQVVLLGDHRVVADGICDEDFQFLWTSPDGLDWSLVSDLGIVGYLHGIFWTGDLYVGYGSPRPTYVGGWSEVVQVWSSASLATWEEHVLDLTDLPEGARVLAWPDVDDDAGVSISYDVVRPRPGLDTTISDLDALNTWLSEAGYPGYPDEAGLEEYLAEIGVDFPLDDQEAVELNSVFDINEEFGTLMLTTGDGITWESDYNAD